jgi:Uma2 family endonuclease
MVQSVLEGNPVERANPSIKLTYADYLLLPDDGLRHEIIEGEHHVTPSPATRHQRILLRLSHLLQTYLDTHPVGEIFVAPFDVLLSESNVFVPDLIYLSSARSHLLTEKNLQGAPDLAVEILSPATRRRDRQLKRDVYQRTGVEEYWIIDPDVSAITIHRRAGSRFAPAAPTIAPATISTPLLPGLSVPLEKLFG